MLLLRTLPPAWSHKLAFVALKAGAGSFYRLDADYPKLVTHAFSLRLRNPIGLAAGSDKNAELIKPLFDLGFGFTEIGSVTVDQRHGNKKRHIFRLRSHKALINRCGLPSDGVDIIAQRLAQQRPAQQRLANQPSHQGAIGINLGFPDPERAQQDAALLTQHLAPFADYLVLNLSCPNAPLIKNISTILEASRSSLRDMERVPPLLIKIDPDIDKTAWGELKALAPLYDGLIAANASRKRPSGLSGRHSHEAGGLSGAPLFQGTLSLTRKIREELGPDKLLIGCGGVSSGKDAYQLLQAGANLVQLYTAFCYQGPPD